MIRHFTIPGAPQGKARPRVVTQGGRVHSYTPAKTASYEALVAGCYKSSYPFAKAATGPVQVGIRAFYEVPKSWPLKKRQEALAGITPPTVKPDADNILKIIADALNGIAWEDDKQIVWATVSKTYSIESKVEVEIYIPD